MTIDHKAIGKRIRFHSRRLDITQAQLAQMIGCSTSFVGLIERGDRTMSIETLVNISNALHLSTDYIVGRKENPT